MNEENNDTLALELLQKADNLQMLGNRLSKLALAQVGYRQKIEERWLKDLEQYMGIYDVDTRERLEKTNGAKAFVNITRAKTIAAEARLSDMLFPSDDKNWSIQPTPVPQLQNDIMNNNISHYDENNNPITIGNIAEQKINEARKRAEAMSNEIDDQLVEARYQSVAREIIHDACLYGIGILKAPVIINRTRKSWSHVADGVYSLEIIKEFRPGVERVSVFDWFPDMSALKKEDCEFEFERKFINRKQLKELAKREGYIVENIEQVLKEETRRVSATGGVHIAKIRELSGVQVNIDDNRFELWEYHGSVAREDLIACGVDVENNELKEYSAVIAFINGIVIKGDINPLETGESPYSVFQFEDDDSSIFGFGVPYLLRNEQRVYNAAWRMTLDNAALCTKPQIVMNPELVEPADGAWDLKAGKIWWLRETERNVNEVFATHEITGHQNELMQIFDVARKIADDVTSLPMLAQGEVGNAPDTATGMSMLMNSANTVLRRVVKKFDDGITKPFITRMYDWNMQFNDNPDIKGDFEVDARGSSALLVKETQATTLMNLMSIAQQPIYSDLTKHAELYRKAIQSQRICADDIIKSDAEIQAEQSKPDPKQAMLELQMKELQAKIDKISSDSAKNQALTDKVSSDKAKVDEETANIRGKSYYEAIQTLISALQAAQQTGADITSAVDSFTGSIGIKDQNIAPVMSLPQVNQAPVSTVPQNTSPQYPPVPQQALPPEQSPISPEQANFNGSPATGIETQRFEQPPL